MECSIKAWFIHNTKLILIPELTASIALVLYFIKNYDFSTFKLYLSYFSFSNKSSQHCMVVACFSFTVFIRFKYLGIQEFDLILLNRVLGNLARNNLNSVNLLRWPTGKKVTGFFINGRPLLEWFGKIGVVWLANWKNMLKVNR